MIIFYKLTNKRIIVGFYAEIFKAIDTKIFLLFEEANKNAAVNNSYKL